MIGLCVGGVTEEGWGDERDNGVPSIACYSNTVDVTRSAAGLLW